MDPAAYLEKALPCEHVRAAHIHLHVLINIHGEMWK